MPENEDRLCEKPDLPPLTAGTGRASQHLCANKKDLTEKTDCETGQSEPRKSDAARELLRDLNACISTQVLGEFYAAVTSPRRQSPLTHEEAAAWVQFWKRLEVQSIAAAQVDLALEIAGRYRTSYYDALILATARLAGCAEVYSEDLNADQDYGGVCVRNPFQPGEKSA